MEFKTISELFKTSDATVVQPCRCEDEEVCILQSGTGYISGLGDAGYVHPSLLQRVQQV